MHEAMENPKNAGRLARWQEDRLRLHPDLFAAELQAKKENRANRFFELAETVGAECFDGLAKAHCQVLVGYLDVKFPNWDARESEATWNYFFPAIAEKFPDLVTKEHRGKLKYPSGPRVATELKDRASVGLVRRQALSPIWALLKGVAIGVVVLGIVLGGLLLLKSWEHSSRSAAAGTDTTSTPAPARPPLPSLPAVSPPATPAKTVTEAPPLAPRRTPTHTHERRGSLKNRL